MSKIENTNSSKDKTMLQIFCMGLIILGAAALPNIWNDFFKLSVHLSNRIFPYLSIGFHCALAMILFYSGYRGYRYSIGKEDGTESKSAAIILVVFSICAVFIGLWDLNPSCIFSPVLVAFLDLAGASMFLTILMKGEASVAVIRKFPDDEKS